jgi:hypothetical protein
LLSKGDHLLDHRRGGLVGVLGRPASALLQAGVARRDKAGLPIIEGTATQDGYRYVSGVGDAFLQQVQGVIGHLLTPRFSVLGSANCARWIRDFFATDLAAIADATLLLDWYHLRVRCAEGRAGLAVAMRPRRGSSGACVGDSGEDVPRTRPGSSLITFGEYLRARQEYIPDYRARWRACRYIGSGQVEKANGLLVVRRQKGKGMHWSG